jgi:hypothetical protein
MKTLIPLYAIVNRIRHAEICEHFAQMRADFRGRDPAVSSTQVAVCSPGPGPWGLGAAAESKSTLFVA